MEPSGFVPSLKTLSFRAVATREENSGLSFLHAVCIDSSDQTVATIATCCPGKLDAAIALSVRVGKNSRKFPGQTTLGILSLQTTLAAQRCRDVLVRAVGDLRDKSVFHAAAKQGSVYHVKKLLHNNVNQVSPEPEDCGATPLILAAHFNTTNVVELLLGKAASLCNMDTRGLCPLHHAALGGNASTILRLLEHGADVHVKVFESEMTAFHCAAQSGNTAAVRVLLEHGAKNVGFRDRKTPLMYAAENGHVQTVELFVQLGCDVNAQDNYHYSSLHYAVKGNNVDVVQLLLQSGSRLDARLQDNQTVLHLASDVPMARFLVQQGCNVRWRDNNGRTPFLCAAEKGATDVVAFFLNNDSEILARDVCESTALHLAFQNNRSDTVKYLMNKLTESIQNRDGVTDFVDVLTACGRNDVLKGLFKEGLSVDSRPRDKQTLLMIAAAYGQLKTVCLLLDQGADVNLTWTNDADTWDFGEKNEYEVNALHCALTNRHEDIAKVLVERGADIKMCNSDYLTPINAAAKQGLTGVVEFLIEQGVDTAVSEGEDTLLVSAVKGGHIKTIKFLLDRGVDASACYDDGETVLHRSIFWAPKENFLEITKLLIERGLDINARSHVSGGQTLLHLAADNDKNTTAELLVELGIDVNATDEHFTSALHVAADNNNVRLAEFLIDRGADLNATTQRKRTPLHNAIENNSVGVVELLLQRGCEIEVKDSYTWTPLASAVRENNLAFVERFLQQGADVHARTNKGRTPLMQAAFFDIGEPAIVKLLLEHGSGVDDVDNDGKCSLHLAVNSARDRKSIVEVLVDKGADVNKPDARGNTPLHHAVSSENYEIAEFLLGRGARVTSLNENGRLPIHSASLPKSPCSRNERQTEIVELLLRHGGDVHSTDADGFLPIHLASKAGNTDLMDICIRSGVDVNAVDNKGRTALHFCGKPEAAEFLIQRGVDVNKLDENGITPLGAVLQRKMAGDILPVLVNHGADIWTKDAKYGGTTLHKAASWGMADVVGSLVERGLDVNAVDKNGDTALHRAASHGKVETLEKLILLGGNLKAANNRGQTPLHIIYAGTLPYSSNETNVLLKYENDLHAVDDKGNTPLHIASLYAKVGAIEPLLAGGSIVNACNADGKIPLHFALYGIFKEHIVEQLLEAGSDVNFRYKDGLTPMQFASMYATDDNLEKLVKHGGDLKVADAWNMTPLHMRATNWENSPSTFELLIEHGCDVRAVDDRGNTALHLAAMLTTPSHVQALLKQNSDMNAGNNQGSTPLHLAAARNDLGIVNLLLEAGCEVDVTDRKGSTPLHLAAVFGQAEVASILVKNGADVHATDTQGSTPVHLAAAFGSLHILHLLLQNGACVQTRDGRGNTAAHPAAANGHVTILQVLFKHGCDARAANCDGETALHFAAGSGQTYAVRLLIENGAECWCLDTEGRSPLDCALMCRQTVTAEALCGWLVDSEDRHTAKK